MRITGSIPRPFGGVSQQPDELRRPQRMAEQINMVTDAVRGLVRRPGSLYRDVQEVGADTYAFAAGSWKALEFRAGAKDYALLVNGDADGGADLDILCVNQTDREFVPVVTHGAAVAALQAQGVGASAALGRYLLMAPKDATPTYTTTRTWAPPENQKRHVIWVRGGAYSRRFAVALIRGNQKFWITYTTPEASYPAQLDTSDLSTADADYSKKVADRTNAYNSAALAWAGAALRMSTAEAIAAGIASEIRIAGFLSASGSIEVVGSTICITDDSIEEVEANDAGDGSLMRAVGNTCSAPELLSTLNFPGKVVKIRPTNDASGQVFYMEAKAKDASSGAFTEVSWEEVAGIRYELTGGLVFASVEAGTCYVSADLDWLDTQLADVGPRYVASVTGDDESTPVPAFFDKPITALAVFQDRLVVAADSFITASRPGDYLNFFRASLLSVSASDPVSFQIIGGEDDTIRAAAVWDRNLFLAGDKRPYVLDGRKPITPGGVSGTAISNLPGMAAVPPVPMGNFLFYVREGVSSASVHQLRPGRAIDTPLTEELTQELDSYIAGQPVSLSASGTPGMLFVRSSENPGRDVFVYAYSDRADAERTQDSWFRWQFTCGNVVACWAYRDELQMVTLRSGALGESAVLDTVGLDGAVPAHPYLDSCVIGDDPIPWVHDEACGPYTVDTATESGALTVFPALPTADFSASSTAVITDEVITFTADDVGAVSYLWDFGDGGTSTLETPTHSYAAVGTYTVTLTVANAAGTTTVTKVSYIGVNTNYLESFELGDLSQYTQHSGADMVDFIVDADSVYHGTKALRMPASAYPPSAIERTFTSRTAVSVTITFMVDSYGGGPQDDALACNLLTVGNPSGAPLVYINPRRESAFDAARRAQLLVTGTDSFPSGVNTYIGASALTVDVWHTLNLTFAVGVNASTWEVVRRDTDEVVASGTFSCTALPTFDQLIFNQDISVGYMGYPTRYDAIHIEE